MEIRLIQKIVNITRWKKAKNLKKSRKLWKEKRNRNNSVIAIGDSHCSFFSGNEHIFFIPLSSLYPALKDINFCDDKLKNFYTLHLGPALAYNLNKKGTKTAAIEKVEKLLNSKILNKNAKILCCFGEIDIRVHVLKQAELQKVPTENIIDQIVSSYTKFLLFLKEQNFNVFAWGPISTQKDYATMNPDYPYYGSEVDRNIATELFNSKLCESCSTNDIGFISIFNFLINEDYTTKEEFLSDGCHLSQKAWVFAEQELKKHSLI